MKYFLILPEKSWLDRPWLGRVETPGASQPSTNIHEHYGSTMGTYLAAFPTEPRWYSQLSHHRHDGWAPARPATSSLLLLLSDISWSSRRSRSNSTGCSHCLQMISFRGSQCSPCFLLTQIGFSLTAARSAAQHVRWRELRDILPPSVPPSCAP